MEEISTDATVYVDPSCPFAWITSRWLAEVEAQGGIELQIRLLSLSVVNEHRELDEWYRGFNDHAWCPARVMAAVAAAHGTDAARGFLRGVRGALPRPARHRRRRQPRRRGGGGARRCRTPRPPASTPRRTSDGTASSVR